MKFGEALEFLREGYPVYREIWDDGVYVVKQVNSDIDSEVVPKMQSLPDKAKELITSFENGSIHYREQCLIITNKKRGDSLGYFATNYVPDWIDIFAEDWKAYGI